jgi:hypothetical protein
MRNNLSGSGGHRQFQNEAIIRIGKKWSPAKADGVLLGIGA